MPVLPVETIRNNVMKKRIPESKTLTPTKMYAVTGVCYPDTNLNHALFHTKKIAVRFINRSTANL